MKSPQSIAFYYSTPFCYIPLDSTHLIHPLRLSILVSLEYQPYSTSNHSNWTLQLFAVILVTLDVSLGIASFLLLHVYLLLTGSAHHVELV